MLYGVEMKYFVKVNVYYVMVNYCCCVMFKMFGFFRIYFFFFNYILGLLLSVLIYICNGVYM